VLSEEARGILRQGGADVDESSLMVRLDRALVETALAGPRPPYAIHPADPGKAAIIGDASVMFAAVAGPPNVMDSDHGRRAGLLEDFKNFIRLQQHFDVIQVLTPAVEPMDVAAELRHLHMTHAQLTLADKFPFIYCRNRAPAVDALKMIDIRHGSANPDGALGIRAWTVVNVNSPLQFDKAMSHGIIDFARAGQLCIITPFTLAGAAAPISLAGAVTQQNAEILAA
jgi:trimethylamine--corrinoid protein Co-methyltransferase